MEVKTKKIGTEYENEEREKTPLEKSSFNVGDFIYCSWGYDQTNINYAKITGKSQTGKTITAKMVKKEKVKGSKNKVNKKVKPRNKTFGDEFRLYIRGENNDILKGSYPYIQGDKNKGTRKGCFFKYKSPKTETRRIAGH